jgi:hypothetical protein
MRDRSRFPRALAVFGGVFCLLAGDAPGQPALPTALRPPPAAMHVALVPLDDRPASLQDVQLAGTLGGIEVTAPPRYRLGRFDHEGDADLIAEWLDKLDVAKLDAVVVSTDMLAYGGWRASRRPDASQEKSLRRIDALGRLKARNKDLSIYAFSTLLGLALADDGRKGAWKESLQRWAVLGGEGAEATALAGQIPPSMLERYRATRARNLAVTKAAIDMASSGAIDFLVVGGVDPSPQGVVKADHDAVSSAIEAPALKGRAVLVSGADQIATLLLVRAARHKLGARHRVHVHVLPDVHDPSATTVDATIATLVAVTGAPVVGTPGARELTCLVFNGGSDREAPGRLADRAAKAIATGQHVAIADIGAPGATSTVPLIEALRAKHLFQRISGYAAGDAALAIASALTQGLLLSDAPPRAAESRANVLLHRLAVDFVYQSVVRPQAIDDYLTPHQIDPAHLDADQVIRVEAYLLEQVKPLVENLIGDVTEPGVHPIRPGPLAVRDVADFTLKLPWGRLDEVEIAFHLTEGQRSH